MARRVDAVVSGDAYIVPTSTRSEVRRLLLPDRVDFQQQMRGTLPAPRCVDISGDSLAKIRIPVPPLEVQREIVRVLDHLHRAGSGAGSGAGSELEARRQYAHYRDSLLTFRADDEVRWFRWASLARSSAVRASDQGATTPTTGIPFDQDRRRSARATASTSSRRLSVVSLTSAAKLASSKPGDVVLVELDEIGRPDIVEDRWRRIRRRRGYRNQFDFEQTIRSATSCTHLLSSARSHAELAQARSRAARSRLCNAEIVRSVLIPVPPLDEQERIVDDPRQVRRARERPVDRPSR